MNIKKKIGRVFLAIFVFIFILSLLAWSVPVWGAEPLTDNVDGLVLDISEPLILPSNPFYYFKIFGEHLKRFFTFSYSKKIDLSIKSASRRLLEARALVKNNSLPDDIKKAIEKHRTTIQEVRRHFFKLLSTENFNSKDEEIFSFLTNSFVSWQKILTEISIKTKDKELKKLNRKVFEENSEILPQFMSGFGGNRSLVERIDNAFSKDKNGQLINLFHLSVLVGLRENFFGYNPIDFWFLERKISGQAIAEIFNTRQIFRNDSALLFQSAFFIDNWMRSKVVWRLNAWVEQSDSPKFFSFIDNIFDFSEEELMTESQEIINQIKSKIKEQENSDWGYLELELNRIENKIKEGNISEAYVIANQANILVDLFQVFIFNLQPKKITLVTENLKKVLDEAKLRLSQYNSADYYLIFDLLDLLSQQFDYIQAIKNDVNLQILFSEIINFWQKWENIEIALGLEEKSLFSYQNWDDFARWCWLERGKMIDDQFVWPECILPNDKPMSLIEWSKEIK